MPRRSGSLSTKTPTVTFRPLLEWQKTVDACDARFIVLCCGRRCGKTVYCEYRLARAALEGFPVAYFAPTSKDAINMWESLRFRLRDIIEQKNEQDRRMILHTGGSITCWSLDNPDNGLGFHYKLVVVDEFCKVKRQQYVWDKTIRPTLADFRGKAILPSTPKGLNYFWELYNRGDKSLLSKEENDKHPDWRSFSFPTSVNPFIHPDEIEQARQDSPEEEFAQEWLASFVSDSGAVFRNVDALAIAEEQTEAIPGHAYSIGVDFGKVKDYSVFAVYDSTLRSIVHIDRSNTIDTISQVDRLVNLCRRFRPNIIIAEQNAIGMGAVELLLARNLPVRPFQTSIHSKARIVEKMVIALEQNNIKLIGASSEHHGRLKQEFKAFTRQRTDSGMIKYGAPRGYHDDIVMGCLLSLEGAEAGVPQWEMVLV